MFDSVNIFFILFSAKYIEEMCLWYFLGFHWNLKPQTWASAAAEPLHLCGEKHAFKGISMDVCQSHMD